MAHNTPGRKYTYYIGIDTGVTTGISIWNHNLKQFVLVDSMTILEAINYVSGFAADDKSEVLVRVEDPRLRTWIPKQKNEKAERGRNRGAGSVMRDAQIWQEFLESSGIPFELVPPKNNKTKTTAEYFRQRSGWQAKTNSHARDAAMLVLGY